MASRHILRGAVYAHIHEIMRFYGNGNTINSEMNLRQSGGTNQNSLSCLRSLIVILCALKHKVI